MLQENIETVRKRLNKAAAKRGIPVEEITLVAVTKTIPAVRIQSARELGIKDFGENRLQEALPKINSLSPEIDWHFLGHLQTNKVKDVLPYFKLIHSLDRMKLAHAIQKEALKIDKVVDVLVQVNIGSEETKYGFEPELVEEALKELVSLDMIKIRGLMAIAPLLEDPEELRPHFRRLNRMFQSLNIPGTEMKYLSMGMTNDFEVAVEEGSNMVRIGTGLFGERVK